MRNWPESGLVWPSSIAVPIPVPAASSDTYLATNHSQLAPLAPVTPRIADIHGYMACAGALRIFCFSDKLGDEMRKLYV